MFKKLVFLLIMIVLVSQFTTSAVFAAAGDCPPPFVLEPAEHHDHHHHLHVGTSTDKNGDEYICVKHVTPDEKIHVHIDNNLP